MDNPNRLMTPPRTQRTNEGIRLRDIISGGILAPVKGEAANRARDQQIAEYVREGLERFDQQEQPQPRINQQ